MCGTGKSQISFAEVQLDRATEYAAEDADVALRLWKLLKLRLPIEGGTRVYEMVDRPLAAIVDRKSIRSRAGFRMSSIALCSIVISARTCRPVVAAWPDVPGP